MLKGQVNLKKVMILIIFAALYVILYYFLAYFLLFLSMENWKFHPTVSVGGSGLPIRSNGFTILVNCHSFGQSLNVMNLTKFYHVDWCMSCTQDLL